MWSTDNRFPAKPFSTPPAQTVKSFPAMPLSERKSRRDLFHVLHKVPAGDSPYVRAKHVQLIEKDPSKAIPLFWAAINAGDRVDSALKDMAVVMKQLNRSDEAIEAIKSFRHLCPFESQESINNVLVELYKRSGRIEEEIEMLHQKLSIINKGIAFGGKRTKLARSQGKKVQITVEQEKSRILGNLAWAYLQHHDYGLAENFYRESLALEADNNKRCNLAICLMHMNRISEAKSLLQSVKASSGNKEMDESYAKSFERAVQMLDGKDPKSALTQTENAELYTQPRTVEGNPTTRASDEDEMTKAFENVMSHTIRNLDGEFESDSAAPKPESRMESCGLKRWVDIFEREEEWMGITSGDVSPLMDDWNEEEFNDENRDSNIGHSRSQLVRRCLWFEEGGNEKKERLQVFRDITWSKDSPSG